MFQRVKDLFSEGYSYKTDLKYLLPFLYDELTVDDFTRLDEAVVLYYFREFMNEDDFILKDLSARFLNRKLFKYKQLRNQEELDDIKHISSSLGYDPRYYIISDNQKQVPYLHYGESGELSEIEILSPSGELSPLPSKSEIVSAILNSKLYKSDKKVFFPKEIKDEVCVL